MITAPTENVNWKFPFQWTLNLTSLLETFIKIGEYTASQNIFIMTSQWAPWRLKSPASQLFASSFVHITLNIEAPRYWPLGVESTGDRWFP